MSAGSRRYQWRKAADIKIGDFVHRWGDDLEIIDLWHDHINVVITVNDGGEIKSWTYKISDELSVMVMIGVGSTTV